MYETHNSHHYFRAGVAAILVLLLAACGKDSGQSIAVGRYTMTVATDPNPPQVGEDAELTARFQNPDEALTACHLAFRQYKPEHEMTSDTSWHSMEHLGKGLFRGRGDEINMGGDWELEFKLDSNGAVQRVTVPYYLEWPELSCVDRLSVVSARSRGRGGAGRARAGGRGGAAGGARGGPRD